MLPFAQTYSYLVINRQNWTNAFVMGQPLQGQTAVPPNINLAVAKFPVFTTPNS
jgi:hypothetical protein